MAPVRTLVESRDRNTALAWSLVAALAVGAVASIVAGDLLWAVYALAVGAAAVAPAVAARDGTTIVAWEVLALAAAPLVARRVGVVTPWLTYVSVAALALVVAVEVDAFSTARMPGWFAVLFVVLATLTVAAGWAILQFASDAWLGTDFLAGRVALMWDLVAAAAAGVGAGLAFELYFRESDGDAAPVGGEAA